MIDKQILIWQLIQKSLQANIPVILLYVLESKGSSPGRQGFFMAVNASGEMAGSIGGGIMEHKFVEMAKQRLSDGSREPGIRNQVHDKAAGTNQSGMICSGEQTIFFYPVKKNDDSIIQQITFSLSQLKNGTLTLYPSGILFNPEIPASNYQFSFQSDNEWEYKEKTGYKNQLFIIGGGHCALALSKLMREMDFYITLFEERKELNTVLQNKYAHEIIIVDDYTALGKLIPSGPCQYLVIMTFGYRTDDTALRSLLDKNFSYIGVLGSKKKMQTLFDEYRKDGVNENFLTQIHAPVGISINSHTPAEIAISIAAEIISTKNQ